MKHLTMSLFFKSTIFQNTKRLLTFLLGLTLVSVFGFYYGVGDTNNPSSVPISDVNYVNNDKGIAPDQDVIGGWSNGLVLPAVGGFGSGQSGVGYYRNDTGWVYAIGNATPANSPLVFRYNVNTNIWTSMAPLPSGRDRLSCAVLKDSILRCGGRKYSYDIH